MEKIGTHIILNGTQCDVDFSNLNLQTSIEAIKKCILESEMTILGECFHDFKIPAGACTYLCLLAESHFSLHTFPEERKITCDIYSCNLTRDFTPELEKITDLVCKAFIV